MVDLARSTVVIVTFNHENMIPRCLEALKATLGLDDDVVVVDNASTDRTRNIVEEEYPWVILVRSEINRGFGAGCNLGASASHSRYLVFLNPDTEPCPGWLDALLAGLQQAQNAGLATARVLLARSPNRVDTFGNEVHISGITTSRGWGEPAECHTRLVDVSAVSGACFAVSRELFRRLGGFDERLFLYYEDTDLSLRARFAGYRCIAVPHARVLHDHRPGFSAAKLRHLERNRWWTLLKLYRWRTIIRLIPVLLLGELVAWAMAALSGPRHVHAKMLAWIDLFSWLPDLTSARTAAFGSASVSDAELLRSHGTRLHLSQVADSRIARVGENILGAAFGIGRTLVGVGRR